MGSGIMHNKMLVADLALVMELKRLRGKSVAVRNKEKWKEEPWSELYSSV